MQLTIPVRLAGRVLGFVSEEAAYANVKNILQVIQLGQRKQVVLTMQLANYLQVSLEVLEQRIAEIEAAGTMTKAEPGVLSPEEKERLRLAVIERQVDEMPAVQAVQRHAAAHAKGKP